MGTMLVVGVLFVGCLFWLLDERVDEARGCLVVLAVFGVVVALCLVGMFPLNVGRGWPRIVK